MNIPLRQIKTTKEPFFGAKYTKSNKADLILNILSKVFFSLYIIAATIISGIVIWLSILPLKYLAILIVVSVVIAAILGFFTFKKFSKKPITRTIKITCITFETIFTAFFVLVFFYLNHTMGFMDSIRASNYQTSSYQICVKKDSTFFNLNDLNGHALATYDSGSDGYQPAFKELSKKTDLKSTNYGSVTAATNAFLDGSADALFIESSLTEVISDIIPNFSIDDIRTLDTIEVKTKITSTASTELNITKDSFNIFISGIDTYGAISTVSRSDVNMIITVNPRTHTILLTSIPRDYYVQLHGTTGLKDKLTHAGLYGINMSINTIEDLFDIKIDFYIRVNFDSTIGLIDALGGIEITPDFTFSRLINGVYCYYEEGRSNHLDGLCALRYARERKAYGTGDLHRIQNQQEVMMAIIDKLTSSKVLLAKYTDILSSMSGTLETNIPSSQIYKLVNTQLDSMPTWTIERISVDGTHIDAPTYTISDQNLFVFIPDEDSVTAATAKINEVMSAN